MVYFEWLAKKNNLPFEYTSSIIDRFFINYINLYQTHPEEIRLCLNKKRFNEKSALHEILYTFLENEDIKKLSKVPLIHEIKQQDNDYILNTTIGTIHLQKASKYFADTSSAFIFQNKTSDLCFEKTCEFIDKNPDYQAIVKYLPNVFTGGHYHAYAKKEDMIVDPPVTLSFLMEQVN